jgi:hypothetical protein
MKLNVGKKHILELYECKVFLSSGSDVLSLGY